MIVLDRSGRLRPALESLPDQPATPCTGEDTETLCGRFTNWLVLAHHVADRCEFLRAWDAQGTSTVTCCGWHAWPRTVPPTG
jgi:lincosamide nucleotidyltransferase